jgi:hypothetical protein
MSNKEQNFNQNFLFCLNKYPLDKCCFLSLKTGARIISITMLPLNLYILFTLINPQITNKTSILNMLISISHVLTFSLLSSGVFNSHIKFCSYGNIGFQVITILQIILQLFTGVFFIFFKDINDSYFYFGGFNHIHYEFIQNTHFRDALLIFLFACYLGVWFIISSITVYFTLVIFSYTKYLWEGNIELINGSLKIIENDNNIPIEYELCQKIRLANADLDKLDGKDFEISND